MELLTLIVSFLLAMSFLSASSCASDHLNLNKQGDHAMFAQPSLPRKLMNLNHEIAKRASEKDLTAHSEFPQASSGTKQHEQEETFINAEEEDDDEEEEGPNKSEYFTMDYRWVRRRRPIHNKQIPFVP